MAKQDSFQKTALRIPKDLHARILEAADISGRSMNAEIIARLEKSFGEGVMSTEEAIAFNAKVSRYSFNEGVAYVANGVVNELDKLLERSDLSEETRKHIAYMRKEASAITRKDDPLLEQKLSKLMAHGGDFYFGEKHIMPLTEEEAERGRRNRGK